MADEREVAGKRSESPPPPVCAIERSLYDLIQPSNFRTLAPTTRAFKAYVTVAATCEIPPLVNWIFTS